MSKRFAIHFAIWFRSKAQENAAMSGTYQAARNLRKQGVPLDYALALLCGRV